MGFVCYICYKEWTDGCDLVDLFHGTWFRREYNIRTGMYSGNISAKSRTIGDLVIISLVKTDMILGDIAGSG